ncbi:hypothetical protein OG203_06545 [Nocardia sp. NBC_01499]|uniref:hypothetical protein n=1 Tax=Nocardia sp. NBC_01499 TaxID=2903597 RepID=UPI003865DF02
MRFWRRVLTGLARCDFDSFVCGNIPQPPADPSPGEVVAYAELTALVAETGLHGAVGQQLWGSQPETIRDRRGLFFSVGDVLMDVFPLVSDGVRPHDGDELDRFVDAHANARGERDSPQFRKQLQADATDTDHRIHRYWSLSAQLSNTPATIGQAHHWLHGALNRSTGHASEN